jgi:peptidoglycan/LPS O-acetylase OafA/YrhL
MAVRGNATLRGADGGRRWLLRGAAAGAGAMIATVLVVMAIVAALVSDAGTQWGDRQTLTGIVFTALWCVAAGIAGAVGAWQAAEGDAPDAASARLAGALGPVVLIVLITLAALGGEGPSPAVAVIEALVEAAGAVVGASALARRLEPGW